MGSVVKKNYDLFKHSFLVIEYLIYPVNLVDPVSSCLLDRIYRMIQDKKSKRHCLNVSSIRLILLILSLTIICTLFRELVIQVKQENLPSSEVSSLLDLEGLDKPG